MASLCTPLRCGAASARQAGPLAVVQPPRCLVAARQLRQPPLRLLARRAAAERDQQPDAAQAGQISAELMACMQAKIAEQLSAQSVVVQDVYGDHQHVSINVVSPAFEGKTSLQRQRMVYKAIWHELSSAVHAVDEMTVLTPDEDEARRAEQQQA